MKKYKTPEESFNQEDEPQAEYHTKRADYIEWNNIKLFIFKSKEDNNIKMSLFVTLSSFFALRISDVLGLTWNDLLDKKEFVLSEKKGSGNGKKSPKKRLITIIPDVQNQVNYCYEKLNIDSPKETIFLNKNKTGSFTRQYINRKLKELFIKYEIPFKNLSTHSFRKSFGRKYLSDNNYSDYSFEILMDLYNHKERRVTKIYLGIRDEEIQDMYKSFKL